MGFVQPALMANGQLTSVYNLEHAVGAAAPNRPDDVKMVQYLLNALDIPLVIDGLCGPKTRSALVAYQRFMRSRGCSILIDGRADRAKGNRVAGSISRTVYTIVWLSQHVQQANLSAWMALGQSVPLKPPAAVDAEAVDYFNVESPQIPASGGL